MPTRIAIVAPTRAPTPIAANSAGWNFSGSVSVAAIAIAMPMMPYRLPRRAVSWLDSPRRLRMNSTPAMSQAATTSR
jgi:hypothetical protein